MYDLRTVCPALILHSCRFGSMWIGQLNFLTFTITMLMRMRSKMYWSIPMRIAREAVTHAWLLVVQVRDEFSASSTFVIPNPTACS